MNEIIDDNYPITIFKSEIEKSLGVRLSKEEFDNVMLESHNTIIDEILRNMKIMKNDLKHIWNTNQIELDLVA